MIGSRRAIAAELSVTIRRHAEARGERALAEGKPELAVAARLRIGGVHQPSGKPFQRSARLEAPQLRQHAVGGARQLAGDRARERLAAVEQLAPRRAVAHPAASFYASVNAR
jgi:hypothetical protein